MALTKLHTEVMSWISGIYEHHLCMALLWSNLNHHAQFVPSVSSLRLPVMVRSCTNQKHTGRPCSASV